MRKALIVGINYYSQIRGLYGCVNDAHAVKKALERNGDGTINFTANLFTAESDADAISRSTLKRLVRELFAEDHEVALLYFAGHGHVEQTGGYLCSSDSSEGRRPLARRRDDVCQRIAGKEQGDISGQLPFRNRRHAGRSKGSRSGRGCDHLDGVDQRTVRDREEWQRRLHVATRGCLERRSMRPGRRQLRRAPCMRTSISRSVRGSSGRCSRRT